jgi:hypothetical protein
MSRKIVQVGTQGVLAQFTSTYEAAKATGVNQSNISKCLNKRLKKAGGFRWLYEDEYVASQEFTNDQAVWFWYFPRLEDKLLEIIVANYNATHQRRRSKQQLHELLPKYLYFVHQLIQAEKRHKKISCGYYAEITCDSRSNFKYVVDAWKTLGVIEVVRESEETTNEEGESEFNTREYRLTQPFHTEFKKKMYFDASYGTMIQRLLERNVQPSLNGSGVQERAVIAEQKEVVLQGELTDNVDQDAAFRIIKCMVDSIGEGILLMTDEQAEAAISAALKEHPATQDQAASISVWVPAYINTYLKALKPQHNQLSQESPKEPVRSHKRKAKSEKEYLWELDMREHKEQQERDRDGVQHVVLSDNIDDIL